MVVSMPQGEVLPSRTVSSSDFAIQKSRAL
jgi:hypothetical protein